MPLPGLKRAVERVLVRAGVAGIAARRTGSRSLILAYHNVVPDRQSPVGDRSLHLPLQDFRQQLDALSSLCDVVALDDAFGPRASSGRPRVAITFDDAYRGAVTWGVEELAQRGMAATIFVAPGLLGDQTFWWDEAAAGSPEGLDPTYRDGALQRCRGEAPAVRHWLAGQSIDLRPDLVPPAARSARVEELAHAVALHPGLTLGAHSWSHPNLAALPDAALSDELRRPLEWLRASFPRVTVPWLAYPYGLESPAVQQAAAAADYTGGLRVSGGWLARGAQPSFAVPRMNIPSGLSTEGFLLRVSGAFRP